MNTVVKKLSVALVAGGLFVGFASGGTKPVAHWSFDDSTNLGKDEVGNNDLVPCIATQDDTPKSAAAGHLGAAVNLSRTTETIGNALRSQSGALPTGTSPFTISAWLKPDTSGSVNTAYLVLYTPVTGGIPGGKWENSNWNGCYLRFAKQGVLAVGFNGWRNCQDANDDCVLQLAVPNDAHCDGKWHHIAVARDAAGVTRLFWDGKKSAEKTIDCSIDSKAAIRLGSYETGNGFSGDYDEVKFFDAALSDDDIVREYTARVTPLAVEETAVDESGNRNYGGITGSGKVTFAGAGYYELLSPISFVGTYRLYSANVDFGMADDAQPIDASSALEIANGGAFNFFGDATIASLSGNGPLGGVTVATGRKLTLADTADASFDGVLSGAGTVEKTGSGALTLKGSTSISNVSVKAGSIAITNDLPFYASSLKAYYRFEDAANITRDLCGGHDLTVAKTPDAPVDCVADGRMGSGIGLGKGASVASGLLAPAATVPSGENAFTVVAWMRPKSDSPSCAYVLVNRTIQSGYPNHWTGASWDGWHVRFWRNGQLALGYTSAWESPESAANLFAFGDLPSATCYKDGKWHQIVVARDESLTTSLYFDGKKIAEKAFGKNQNVSATARLALGAQDAGNSFSGDYDEVQVWSKALSDDEVAANYAATRPVAATRIIDDATARWTFDRLEAEGDRQVFRDTGAAGLACDLMNTTDSAGNGVLCVSGEDINGGAAYVKNSGSYLQLFDSARAGTNLVQYGWPTFTISIRIKNVSCTGLGRQPVFCFGNAKTAEGCLRLSYEGRTPGNAPQSVRILAGRSYTNGVDGVVLADTTSTSSEKAPWVTFTFVNDQEIRTMTVYRDGLPIQKISTHGNQMGDFNQTSFAFDLSRLDIGYNTYGKYCGFMVDDLCVFRKRVLSDADVKRLVREQAGATAAPLEQSAVEMAEGASLRVNDRDCAFASLRGHGSVEIGPYASLFVPDWSLFNGTITGAGAVVVSGWGPKGRLAHARVAEAGSVAFDGSPEPGLYQIVAADVLDLPGDFSHWTVSGLDTKAYRFKAKDGVFSVKIRGGFCLIVK